MTTVYYTLADVSGILGLEPQRVRELVRRTLVTPEQDGHGRDQFTFQDLVLLRTAAGLLTDRVPLRLIKQALDAVARDLPQDRPLSGVRVKSEGRRIVVEGDATRWEPATGQLLFDFGQGVPVATIRALPTSPDAQDAEATIGRMSSDEWYTLGRELEASSSDEARDAFRRTLELDPFHPFARVRLGRLLHDSGSLDASEAQYRLAESLIPSADAAFNLGVLLEDRERWNEAETAYRRAITLESDHTGALLNLAKILERQGRKKDALRTLKAYYFAIKDPDPGAP